MRPRQRKNAAEQPFKEPARTAEPGDSSGGRLEQRPQINTTNTCLTRQRRVAHAELGAIPRDAPAPRLPLCSLERRERRPDASRDASWVLGAAAAAVAAAEGFS